MSMTRKHYNILVSARDAVIDEMIGDADVSFEEFVKIHTAIKRFAEVLCYSLEDDNPTVKDDDGVVVRRGFNRKRFIAAMSGESRS